MSTRKPKPSLPYPTDLLTERLQLITVGDNKPSKDPARALWPAEESALPERASRPQKTRLH